MRTLTHLFAFAGGGNTDPITPAFDPRLSIKQATLLYSDAEAERARWLAEVLKDGGKAVQLQPIPGLSHFSALRTALAQHLAAAPGKVLNLSGSDAARAALAQQAAQQASLPVCVVEPETDRLHWISAPPHFQGFDVADRITLDGYLAAHGYVCESAGAWLGDAPDPLDDIARWLGQLAFSSPRVIESFRDGTLLHGNTSQRPIGRGPLRHIVQYLQARKLLHTLPDGRICVPQPEHRTFISGGWLERWLFRLVIEIAGPGRLQDAARGLRVVNQHGVANEFDLAVLRDNALYLAECKGFARPGVGNETLFKLHSLSEQGDLNAHSLLLCTRALTPTEALRAESLEILVIGGCSPAETRERIARWLHLD